MKNILVSGTSKNDIISNSGSKVTINADAGSDTIVFDYALRSVIQYTEGDGNDTLKIVGSSYSTKKSGDNLIVTVGGRQDNFGRRSLFGYA